MTVVLNQPLRSRPTFESLVGVYDKDFAVKIKSRPWSKLADSPAMLNVLGQLDGIRIAQERAAHQRGILDMLRTIAGQFGVPIAQLRTVHNSLQSDRESQATIETDDDDPPKGGGGGVTRQSKC